MAWRGLFNRSSSTHLTRRTISRRNKAWGQTQPGYFTRSHSDSLQHRTNAHFCGLACQIQFVPTATHPIAPSCGLLSALVRQRQRLGPSTRTNSPQGLLVSGLSLAGTSRSHLRALGAHRRLPRRAHPCVQAWVAAQASRTRLENEVSIKRSFDKSLLHPCQRTASQPTRARPW